MKRFIFSLFSVLIFLSLKAQEEPQQSPGETPPIIARISLISPKLIAEIAPSESFTLITGFWLKTSFWESDDHENTYYSPSVSPSFTFEPRYYFNLADRRQKGRRTDYFSGWYLGFPLNIEFPEFSFSMGGAIGFQTTMGKRWYFNLSFGPGIKYKDAHFVFDGAGDLGLGIILNSM